MRRNKGLLTGLIAAIVMMVGIENGFSVTVQNPMTTNLDGGAYNISNVTNLEATSVVTTDVITKGPWVDARAYNAGAFNDTTITVALNAIGSSKKTLLLAPGTWQISNSITIASNVNLRFEQGAALNISATKTVTINGTVDAPINQIFSGSGTASFGAGYVKEFYAQWWGAKADGITDDAVSVQAALDAAASSGGGTVVICGTCAVGSAGWTGLNLSSKSNVTIKGEDYGDGLKLLAVPTQYMPSYGSTWYVMLKFTSCSKIVIRNLDINVNSLGATGIGLESCTDSVLEGNYIHDVTAANLAGVQTADGNRNRYINNRVDNCYSGLNLGVSNAGKAEKYAVVNGNILKGGGTGHHIGACLQHATIADNISMDSLGVGLTTNGFANSGEISKHVVFEGNVVTGAGLTGIEVGTVGAITNENISIVNNTIAGCGSVGIYTWHLTDSIISGNIVRDNNTVAASEGIFVGAVPTTGIGFKKIIISNNLCYDSRSGAARTQSIGIHVDSANFAIEDIVIQGNYCSNHKDIGMFIVANVNGTGKNLIVSGNECFNNDRKGIQIEGVWTDGLVSGNLATGNSVLTGDGDIWLSQVVADSFLVTGNRCDKMYLFSRQVISGNSGGGIKTFTANDATPDVGLSVTGSGHTFKTANTLGTTITMFDNGHLEQTIKVIFGDNNTTIDFTVTNLKGNGGVDWAPSTGDHMTCVYDGTNWYCDVSK